MGRKPISEDVPLSSISKDYRPTIQALLMQGCVLQNGTKHIKVKEPNGEIISVLSKGGNTDGIPRGLKNFQANCKRRGFLTDPVEARAMVVDGEVLQRVRRIEDIPDDAPFVMVEQVSPSPFMPSVTKMVDTHVLKAAHEHAMKKKPEPPKKKEPKVPAKKRDRTTIQGDVNAGARRLVLRFMEERVPFTVRDLIQPNLATELRKAHIAEGRTEKRAEQLVWTVPHAQLRRPDTQNRIFRAVNLKTMTGKTEYVGGHKYTLWHPEGALCPDGHVFVPAYVGHKEYQPYIEQALSIAPPPVEESVEPVDNQPDTELMAEGYREMNEPEPEPEPEPAVTAEQVSAQLAADRTLPTMPAPVIEPPVVGEVLTVKRASSAPQRKVIKALLDQNMALMALIEDLVGEDD